MHKILIQFISNPNVLLELRLFVVKALLENYSSKFRTEQIEIFKQKLSQFQVDKTIDKSWSPKTANLNQLQSSEQKFLFFQQLVAEMVEDKQIEQLVSLVSTWHEESKNCLDWTHQCWFVLYQKLIEQNKFEKMLLIHFNHLDTLQEEVVQLRFLLRGKIFFNLKFWLRTG